MKYFLVFQKTFKEESSKGYLWAPQKMKNGKGTCFHWENMTKVKKGDIIFSIYKRKIVSINKAKENCKEEKRPEQLLELWDNDGWLVETEYNILPKSINIEEHIEEILRLCPQKYSPYNKNGRGSQGYLFELKENLAFYLINLIRNANGSEFIKKVLENKEEDKKYIIEIEREIPKNALETEKARIIKARVGQGKFRENYLIDRNVVRFAD